MRVVSVIGQKGGSGKTPLVLSLAVRAEADDQAVLVADLDPQASASGWGDRREAETPVVLSVQPVRLAKTLQEARDRGADLVFVDTPARSDQAHAEAAKAADLVLVPSRLTALDVETIGRTVELVRLAKGPPCVVVFNAVPPRGARRSQAEEVVRSLGEGVTVCPAHFGERRVYGDAPAVGQTAAEYDTRSPASAEIEVVYQFIMQTLKRLATKAEDHYAGQTQGRPEGDGQEIRARRGRAART